MIGICIDNSEGYTTYLTVGKCYILYGIYNNARENVCYCSFINDNNDKGGSRLDRFEIIDTKLSGVLCGK